MTTPYASATSGIKARDEIAKLLVRFGCTGTGFYDDHENHEVILAFKHRGRPMQIRASAKGWAQFYLKENPYSYRKKQSRAQYEAAALAQGLIAVNSILRDWIKGQITAVESGLLSFEAVFMPLMLTTDGRSLIDHLTESGVLPRPEEGQRALPPK